ncbi:TRP-like ion channel protein flc1 [Exophiala dermatitidis]
MWRPSLIALASLAYVQYTLATDILKTDGFSDCNNGTSTVKVNHVDISFDRSTNEIQFDVSGTSTEVQNVTAELVVTAYGVQVYEKEFDPCDDSTKVDQLCPVPEGTFGANGTQKIPSEYTSMIPSIAFSLPDLEGSAQLILKAKDGKELACIKSGVTNGKTVEVPAVSYVAAAVAAAALAVSLVGAAASGAHPGSTSSSPGFSEVMWWFQGMAMNGMHSVQYPAIYRSFSKNFGFSTGLVSWAGLQDSIDSFRSHTGGNLTNASYESLKNSTLVYSDGSTTQTTTGIAKRAIILLRDIDTSINETSSSNSSTSDTSTASHLVHGIQGYVEQLTIPETNTFMTVLLIFAIVIAAIVVGILLFKVILEAWSLFGQFPKSLTTFRKEYWRVMAQTITTLIMLLYGVWTLYCIFQFTHGDSWAAKLLAGVTLATFTGILLFYTWKIWSTVQKLKKLEGDASALYENKETWKRYKIFYENYKRGYWWLFIPAIVYMFAKGCVLAAGDGHGLVQTIGQLIIEALMLCLLLWSRPYNRKSGNWINIIIQVVRVLSVICILVFVEELGIAQTTKTITGVVLIAVQSGLTAILALLIVINSIITCCKENPHRKRRKQAEKMHENDLEGDAYLLMQHNAGSPAKRARLMSDTAEVPPSYEPVRAQALSNRFGPPLLPLPHPLTRNESHEVLVKGAAGMGMARTRSGGYRSISPDRASDVDGSPPPPLSREPKLPDLGFERYRHV